MTGKEQYNEVILLGQTRDVFPDNLQNGELGRVGIDEQVRDAVKCVCPVLDQRVQRPSIASGPGEVVDPRVTIVIDADEHFHTGACACSPSGTSQAWSIDARPSRYPAASHRASLRPSIRMYAAASHRPAH